MPRLARNNAFGPLLLEVFAEARRMLLEARQPLNDGPNSAPKAPASLELMSKIIALPTAPPSPASTGELSICPTICACVLPVVVRQRSPAPAGLSFSTFVGSGELLASASMFASQVSSVVNEFSTSAAPGAPAPLVLL